MEWFIHVAMHQPNVSDLQKINKPWAVSMLDAIRACGLNVSARGSARVQYVVIGDGECIDSAYDVFDRGIRICRVNDDGGGIFSAVLKQRISDYDKS